MTNGIKFGSGAPSAAFQRIPSVKLDQAKQEVGEKKAASSPPQAVANSLASSISNNNAAGSVLNKISHSVSNKQSKREVAKANQDSAKASVEEVESLARELARKVASSGEEALNAHRTSQDRTHELLRE